MVQQVMQLWVLVWSASGEQLAVQDRHREPAAVGAARADTLSSPPVLVNLSSAPNTVEVTITAAPARLSLVSDAPSELYAYNGRVPGPTLGGARRRPGDRPLPERPA